MSARLCCAYLRVYQPASALSEAEHVEVRRANVATGPSNGSAFGLLAPEECSEVYEKDVDGEAFFCPTHARLRWLLALIAFEQSIPDAVPIFFSRKEVADARRELETIECEHPGIRPPIVQSLWHVPPQWFVCFDDAERRVEHVAEHPTIRYETRIESARQRVDHALDTVTGGIVHPVIVGVIYELKEWLKGFDDRSVLELDYASVASLFAPDDIADDHSAADVWQAIAALGEGDGKTAGLYYRKVHERWAQARLRVGSLN